jgi:hypothetical protein
MMHLPLGVSQHLYYLVRPIFSHPSNDPVAFKDGINQGASTKQHS